MSERRFLSRERLSRMMIEQKDKLPFFLDVDGSRMMWVGFRFINLRKADGTEAVFVSDAANRPEGMEDWNG